MSASGRRKITVSKSAVARSKSRKATPAAAPTAKKAAAKTVDKAKRQAIVGKAEAYRMGQGWRPASKGGSKLPPKMQAMIKAPTLGYVQPAGEPKKVVAKRMLSAKTGKPMKKAAGQRKIVLEYTYEDGSTWKSKATRPSKPVLAMFKSQTIHKEDVDALAPSAAAKELIFERSITVAAGGLITTTREAVAKLLGSWTMPSKGIYEVLIFWRVYADLKRRQVLDAPPSKRFTVNAEAMRSGYGQFLRHLKEMKLTDLEDATGLSLDELKDENPEAVRNYLKELTHSADIPKNSTRAFIEKQMLAMAKGRGVYMSDKSQFAAHAHGPKKRGKKTTKKRKEATQAKLSDLTMMVWKISTRGPKPKARKKKKGA